MYMYINIYIYYYFSNEFNKDFKHSKFSYLFNPNTIAKRATAKLIVKKFIDNNNIEYIINFLNVEHINMVRIIFL